MLSRSFIYIQDTHIHLYSTEILILDSLGAEHPQVHVKLTNYLRNEARLRNRCIDKSRMIVSHDIEV